MVRLCATTGKYRISAAIEGIGKHKLQFPDFVTREAGTGKVVPLNIQLNSQLLTKSLEWFKGRGGVSQIETGWIRNFLCCGIHSTFSKW